LEKKEGGLSYGPSDFQFSTLKLFTNEEHVSLVRWSIGDDKNRVKILLQACLEKVQTVIKYPGPTAENATIQVSKLKNIYSSELKLWRNKLERLCREHLQKGTSLDQLLLAE